MGVRYTFARSFGQALWANLKRWETGPMKNYMRNDFTFPYCLPGMFLGKYPSRGSQLNTLGEKIVVTPHFWHRRLLQADFAKRWTPPKSECAVRIFFRLSPKFHAVFKKKLPIAENFFIKYAIKTEFTSFLAAFSAFVVTRVAESESESARLSGAGVGVDSRSRLRTSTAGVDFGLHDLEPTPIFWIPRA